jgi:transcriptional regulator with XRE-family HTH domain
MMIGSPEMRRAVGNNLRCARGVAGLTQEELAALCHVPRETVNRLERGKQEPKLSTLALFAVAMGIPFTSLMLGIDELVATWSAQR